MIAILTCILITALVFALVRWFAAAPLLGTLNGSIDRWADAVHGKGGEDPA